MSELPNKQETAHYNAVAEFRDRMPFIAVPGNYMGPTPAKQRWETALLLMATGMELYAQCHKAQYDDPIGLDYYMGDQMEEMLEAFRNLMNGEKGRLDGALMSEWIRKFAEEHALRVNY